MTILDNEGKEVAVGTLENGVLTVNRADLSTLTYTLSVGDQQLYFGYSDVNVSGVALRYRYFPYNLGQVKQLVFIP